MKVKVSTAVLLLLWQCCSLHVVSAVSDYCHLFGEGQDSMGWNEPGR